MSARGPWKCGGKAEKLALGVKSGIMPLEKPKGTALMDANIEEVQILNSEINTRYYMHVRRDRLAAFSAFVVSDRRTAAMAAMPGLSGAAIAGLDAIFAHRPKKFPVQDILNWLCGRVIAYPPVTTHEIEDALERFSVVYPPDVACSLEG
jgi:hypothetical protein